MAHGRATAPGPLEPAERDRYGVFGVGRHLVAIPVDRIEDMVVLPRVHAVPGRARTSAGSSRCAAAPGRRSTSGCRWGSPRRPRSSTG